VRVLIIPEDFVRDQYMLQPIAEAMMKAKNWKLKSCPAPEILNFQQRLLISKNLGIIGEAKVGKQILIYVLLLLAAFVPGAFGEKTLNLGIIHLLERHPDHQALREGFLARMRELGYVLELRTFDANTLKYPDTFLARAADAAKEMESNGVELIYCTGIYHGVVHANLTIPVIEGVFVSPMAQGIAVMRDGKMFSKTPATGVIFNYPFAEIVRFVRETLPHAKTLAYLNCPTSPLSRPVEELNAAAAKAGLNTFDATFGAKREIIPAAKRAVASSDVAFGTNDIGAMGYDRRLLGFAASKKFPILLSMFETAAKGALATIQWDWKSAGRLSAEKAHRVLNGESPQQIPITTAGRIYMGINQKVAEGLGITVPEKWLEMARNSGLLIR
jgi:putative ABC transport system substrate-binding protein